MYEVYMLPNCEHCHEAMKLMREKLIPFTPINAGVKEGIDSFREFYAKHRDEIKRVNGEVTLPVVVYQDNGNTRIHQGTEGLEKFLGIK